MTKFEFPPPQKILLVDDEPDITQTIKQGLEQDNFLVDAFTSPVMALENFRRNSEDYCIILSDVRMPEMNGFELVREAKYLNPDIKTVLMTAFEINGSEFSKVMPSTKVDYFVRKPVSVDLLKSVILNHIGKTNMLLGDTNNVSQP